MSWIFTIVFSGLLFTSNQGLTDTEYKPAAPDVPTTAVVKFDETDRFEQTYPLAANGRVSVSNVNGSITAEGWDRNEVKLIAVKTADTKERLGDVEIKIESRADSFSVETDYGNWKSNNGNRWRDNGKLVVDYQLMVPRGAVLDEIETVNGSITVTNFNNLVKASAVNGTVKASSLRGNANLSTVNGEVLADFGGLDPASKISLNTVNGKVNLTLPSDANATLKVDSLNGNITNEFGLPVRKGKYVGRDLYGRLGNGDVRIKMDSVNGDLKILRQNDGKSPNPVTNLLQQKDNDDEDWDSDMDNMDTENSGISKADREKIRAEMARAKSDAEKAMSDASREMANIKPEIARAAAEGAKQAAEALRSESVQNAIKDGLKAQAAVLARMSEISFFPSMPRVERRSDSFAVNGIPKVTVVALGCAVKVTGWDRSEVKYSVTQLAPERNTDPINVTETHTNTSVDLNVKADGRFTRTSIEVFVPKRSNLVIKTDVDLRVEGVTGDIELTGEDGAINVRDSGGKLTVASVDGRIRVIGFKGELDAQTSDGATMLEGDFEKLTARSSDGEIIVTLAENASATVRSRASETVVEGLPALLVSDKDENREYRIGNGGSPFKITTDGRVVLRSVASLQDLL